MPSGLARIDGLYEGVATARPITATDTDPETTEAIQDLLRGHGYKSMPSYRDAAYGRFGKATTRGVLELQRAWGMKPDARNVQVDRATLVSLIDKPHSNPIAARVFITMRLGGAWDDRTRILAYVSDVEGRSQFDSVSDNRDQAGFAFGILQWTQKPRRLTEIMEKMNGRNRPLCLKIFGGADEWDGARAHARKPNGGVDPETGETPAADARFDFCTPRWIARFRMAAHEPELLKAQYELALGDFDGYAASYQAYWPTISTFRARAFMSDLVNHHGERGAREIFAAADAGNPQHDEATKLTNLQVKSLERIAKKRKVHSAIYRAAKERREHFRTSPRLER